MERPATTPCPGDRLTVFQQHSAGSKKIQGITRFGRDISIVEIIDFPTALPDFIDDPAPYFPKEIKGNIVLSFLRHPDLADYAAHYCARHGVAMIASGPRKIAGARSPFTCCGLARDTALGSYGRQFGIPEYRITLRGNRISAIEVVRGASCGASWLVLPKLLNRTPAEALEIVAREVQYLCQADPSSFDPVSGHSPLHFAGNIHFKALQKALATATGK